MPIEARHSQPCPGCGTRIHPGDQIVADDEAEGWVHVRCGYTPTETPAHPLCTICWIHHPGDCD